MMIKGKDTAISMLLLAICVLGCSKSSRQANSNSSNQPAEPTVATVKTNSDGTIPSGTGVEKEKPAAGKGNVLVVGLDGSPDVAESIKAGEIKATVLQPVVQLSQMAAEQAHKYITAGKTGVDEKQSVDCILITPENVKNYTLFGLKE